MQRIGRSQYFGFCSVMSLGHAFFQRQSLEILSKLVSGQSMQFHTSKVFFYLKKKNNLDNSPPLNTPSYPFPSQVVCWVMNMGHNHNILRSLCVKRSKPHRAPVLLHRGVQRNGISPRRNKKINNGQILWLVQRILI